MCVIYGIGFFEMWFSSSSVSFLLSPSIFLFFSTFERCTKSPSNSTTIIYKQTSFFERNSPRHTQKCAISEEFYRFSLQYHALGKNHLSTWIGHLSIRFFLHYEYKNSTVLLIKLTTKEQKNISGITQRQNINILCT